MFYTHINNNKNMCLKIYTALSHRLFILAWLAAIFLIIAHSQAPYIWIFELFTLYTPYASVALLLAGICYPPTRHILWRLLFLSSGIALSIWCFSPFSVYLQESDTSPRIAYQNVDVDNTQREKTLEQLVNTQADVLVLLEADKQWKPLLKKLKDYRIGCDYAYREPYAQVLIRKNSAASCKGRAIHQVMVFFKITHSDGSVTYAINAPLPISQEFNTQHHIFMRGLNKHIRQETAQSVLVVGDMNTSAFSPIYREFVAGTALKRAMSRATPTWLPFGVSTDHVFSNQNVSVERLGWAGSDHRGLLIRW